MSEILQLVITSLISIIGTGGIGSIFYFKLQKRAKEAEVKAVEVDVKTKEITNLSASNEEWIKLYNNCLAEKEKLREVVLIMSNKITEGQKQKDKGQTFQTEEKVTVHQSLQGQKRQQGEDEDNVQADKGEKSNEDQEAQKAQEESVYSEVFR